MAGDFCTFCANRFARQSDRIPKGFYDKSSDELSSDASNSRLIGEPNEESLLAGSDIYKVDLAGFTHKKSRSNYPSSGCKLLGKRGSCQGLSQGAKNKGVSYQLARTG